jgi:hypothetical protein
MNTTWIPQFMVYFMCSYHRTKQDAQESWNHVSQIQELHSNWKCATVVENSGNQLNTNQSHNFGSFAFTRDLCFGTAD